MLQPLQLLPFGNSAKELDTRCAALDFYSRKVPCFLDNIPCLFEKVAHFFENVPCFLGNVPCFLRNVRCFFCKLRGVVHQSEMDL